MTAQPPPPAPADPQIAADAGADPVAHGDTGIAAEQGLQEPVLLPPKGLVWATLAVLMFTAAVAVLLAPPVRAAVSPSLRLQGWAQDDRDLAELAAREDALLKAQSAQVPQRAGFDEVALRRDLARWLQQEAELGALDVQSSLPARVLLADLQERVRTLVLTAGPDALRAVAVRLGRDAARAVENAILGAQSPQADAAVDALVPGLLKTLRAMNMGRWLADPTTHTASVHVIEALAQQRVFDLAVRVSERPRLGSDQTSLLLRFRVEAHDGLSLQRRLALLDQLAATDPTYPTVYVRGVLLARAGRCDQAVGLWRQAIQMHQQATLARANLAWCLDQLGEQGK